MKMIDTWTAHVLGYEFDHLWATVKNDGRIELWVQNLSSHAWKQREYPVHLVEYISPDKVAEMRLALAHDIRARRLAAREAKAASLDFESWVATLPEKLDEWTFINHSEQVVCDAYGNIVLPLRPEMMGKTASEIARLVADIFAEMGEEFGE